MHQNTGKFLKFLESMNAVSESDKTLIESIKSGFMAIMEEEGPEESLPKEGEHTIHITYDKWDEESVEAGETDDKGFLGSAGMEITTPDYISMEPDSHDIKEGLTAVDKTVTFLRDNGPMEYSGDRGAYSGWFTHYGEMDTQGIHENRSYHLEGYSHEEVEQIVARLK